MARKNEPAPFDGLVIVDKPPEWTSHDVVGRLRRLIGTRRIGHGGTLDPMATGVLICGVGKATKLLGRISDADKTYEATVRLGVSTTTDDADGEVTSSADAKQLSESGMARIDEQIRLLTGDINQRPSSVSAIKVNGQRAYKLVRDGEDVQLASRPVRIFEFTVLATRCLEVVVASPTPITVIDLDVRVTCSTGTYVRALARDLGEALGVGGHLTRLRRTRVGDFSLADSRTLDELAQELTWTPLPEVCRQLFPCCVLSADQATAFGHGRHIEWPHEQAAGSVVAAFDEEGLILGLAEQRAGILAPTVVWQPT